MLHYEITEPYINFIATLPFAERGNLLWKSQAILSKAGGYLKMKVKDLTNELGIYKMSDKTYALIYSDFQKIVLIDGKKSEDIPEFAKTEISPILSMSIKDAISSTGNSVPDDDLEHYLEQNYFTSWFIHFLGSIPSVYRKAISSKEEALATIAPKKEEVSPKEETKRNAPTKMYVPYEPIVSKPKVKQAIFKPALVVENKNSSTIDKQPSSKATVTISKNVQNRKTNSADGEKYERLVLKELQKSYEQRLEKLKERQKELKSAPAKKLSHVKFAPKEIVISYTNQGTCLDQLIKKTTQNGCRLSSDDWKILLANTVNEYFAKEIEYRYPNHVVYTDEPNKGNLRLAIIVKYDRSEKADDDELYVKKVKSKTAAYQKELPSGAFENIDEDDYLDALERKGDYTIRKVKSKVATFTPKIELENINDFDDFDLSLDINGFLIDESEETYVDDEEDIEETLQEENHEPSYPKYWKCFLCGKKKSYTGEPAETVKLKDGRTVYLCKKHRGKM